MRRARLLLRSFAQDERGAFALLFAVMATVVIALSGSAVDFTVTQQARTRAQTTLDAAALALQSQIYTATPDSIQASAQALLVAQLADSITSWGNCNTNSDKAPCAYVTAPSIDTSTGQLTLTANLKVPTYFVSLVGVTSIPAQIVSTATRKKLSLEVSMVLDNSGSMAYTMGYNKVLDPNPNKLPTRMQTLQDAANCAANILFYGVTSCSASTAGLTANANVKMGIVPFTQEVNVGSGNANATWIDRTGAASITLNNFDSDDNPTNTFSGTVDRIGMFSTIKYNNTALSWGGCVEARINNGSTEQYDTDDTPPTTGDTLYTPLFAPDEPGSPGTAGHSSSVNGDSFYNSYLSDSPSMCSYAAPSCVEVDTKTGCGSGTSRSSSGTAFTTCQSTSSSSFTLTVQGATTHPSSCSFVTDLSSSVSPNPSYASTKVASNNYTNTATTTFASNRALQERLCKYGSSSHPATMSNAAVQGSVYGPNGDCPANAVTPLTSTPGTITQAINGMSPQGGTNITEGAVWGWHVLSPKSPFDSKGADYSNATSKVMIIMTDGENTIYPNTNMNDAEFYSAYGFPWNNRLGVVSSTAADLEAVMNTRLGTICSNAKTAGITVYTIGVDVADTSDPTNNTSVLTDCASSTSDAYFPNTASDLTNAFTSIANQLAALRLAQ